MRKRAILYELYLICYVYYRWIARQKEKNSDVIGLVSEAILTGVLWTNIIQLVRRKSSPSLELLSLGLLFAICWVFKRITELRKE